MGLMRCAEISGTGQDRTRGDTRSRQPSNTSVVNWLLSYLLNGTGYMNCLVRTINCLLVLLLLLVKVSTSSTKLRLLKD